MYARAKHFKRMDLASNILKAKTGVQAKSIGKQVLRETINPTLSRNEWAGIKEQVMMEALIIKFVQQPELTKTLLATGNVLLVEATKDDLFWGSGIDLDVIGGTDPGKWKGENRMGLFLMALRTELTDTIRLLQLQSITAFPMTTNDISNLKVVAKEILLKVPLVKLHPPPSKQPVIRKRSHLSCQNQPLFQTSGESSQVDNLRAKSAPYTSLPLLIPSVDPTPDLSSPPLKRFCSALTSLNLTSPKSRSISESLPNNIDMVESLSSDHNQNSTLSRFVSCPRISPSEMSMLNHPPSQTNEEKVSGFFEGNGFGFEEAGESLVTSDSPRFMVCQINMIPKAVVAVRLDFMKIYERHPKNGATS